jgi:hypothetical protein
VSQTRLLPIALLAIALAGCASGQNDVTSHEHETPWEADANIGNVQIRDVVVSPSTGSSAQGYVTMVLLGNGTTGDQLTDVTLSDGGTVTPSDPTAFKVSPNRVLSVTDPDLGTATAGPTLAVSGLTAPLQVGTTVDVTLTFANAGQVKLTAPVRDDSGSE